MWHLQLYMIAEGELIDGEEKDLEGGEGVSSK